jgi:hypothetical protein
VLPDVDVLWLDSAEVADIVGQVPVRAPREDACFSIDCADYPQFTSNCDLKNNGNLGNPEAAPL